MNGIEPALDFFASMAIFSPLALALFMLLAFVFQIKLPEKIIALVVELSVFFALAGILGIVFLFLSNGVKKWGYEPFPTFHLESFHFDFQFYFDWLSLSFATLALLLCFVIAFFSQRYMHREPGYQRFFVLYSIFVSGIVIASLSGTIESLFVGWEMVGLSSALLVAFFHERIMPTRNGLHLWIVYRISDAALFLASYLLHHALGQGFFQAILEQGSEGLANEVSSPVLVGAGVLIFLASACKSALFPFSGWLPRAMEGPTPTSAIFYGALSIHLGAFLLLRLNPIVQLSPILAWIVVFFGILTALVSGIIANAQADIKSILAYATLTQVGIIIAEIGFGLELLPLIHIIGHASLRTYQFLRAPSSFAYYKSLEESLGRTDLNKYTPKGKMAQTGPLSLAIYSFALNRGGMDSMLEKFITKPFVQMFKLADIFEKKWGSILAGTEPSKLKTPEERA